MEDDRLSPARDHLANLSADRLVSRHEPEFLVNPRTLIHQRPLNLDVADSILIDHRRLSQVVEISDVHLQPRPFGNL